VSLLPTELASMLTTLDSLIGSANYVASGRAGLAVFLVRIEGDLNAQVRAIEGVRQKLTAGQGSAVIVRGSPELRARTDVWGPIGDSLPLMRAVKRQFDPIGTHNVGRGPGGL
jgi:glycolate oxidase FAD binding subunit